MSTQVHMDEWRFNRNSLELTERVTLLQEVTRAISTLATLHSVVITAELTL